MSNKTHNAPSVALKFLLFTKVIAIKNAVARAISFEIFEIIV